MKKVTLTLCLVLTPLVLAETIVQEWHTIGRKIALRAISPDARYVATVTHVQDHKVVSIFDIRNGVLLPTVIVDRDSMAIAFSPDSQQLLVGDFHGHLKFYDLVTLQLVHDLEVVRNTPISAITPSNPGISEIFISTSKGSSHWAYPSLIQLALYSPIPLPYHASFIDEQDSWRRFTAAISPDGLYAVEGDATLGHLRLFELKTRNEIQKVENVFAQSDSQSNQGALPDSIDIPCVGFSDRATIVALVVDIENALTWNELSMSGQTLTRESIAYVNGGRETQGISEDGNSVVTVFEQTGRSDVIYPRSGDCAAWVRNVRSYHEPEILNSPRHSVMGTALLSRDGKTAVTLEPYSVLRVWRLP